MFADWLTLTEGHHHAQKSLSTGEIFNSKILAARLDNRLMLINSLDLSVSVHRLSLSRNTAKLS